MVALGNGDGTFRTPAVFPSGASTYLLAAGDFNGDGRLDLATYDDVAVAFAVILCDGAGGFAAPLFTPLGDGVFGDEPDDTKPSDRAITAADFDVVENALRGQWTIPCERGALRVSITLAPTMPPLVQFLDITHVPTPEPPKRRGYCTG